MEQDNAHHDPPDKQGPRRAGRDDCGLPEHPDLSCTGAAEFTRARTRWDPPRPPTDRCSPGGSPDLWRARTRAEHLTWASTLGARARSPRLSTHGPVVRLAGAPRAQRRLEGRGDLGAT